MWVLMIALDLADCNPPEGEILPNVAVAFSIWEGVYIKCMGEVSAPYSPDTEGFSGLPNRSPLSKGLAYVIALKIECVEYCVILSFSEESQYLAPRYCFHSSWC